MESKFWISKDGQNALGQGTFNLLKEVDRLGSLNKAAKEFDMSYSKAWSVIKRSERLLGYSILKTEVGGLEGGGSQLTPKAKLLIGRYEKFLDEAEKKAAEAYKKYFGDLY